MMPHDHVTGLAHRGALEAWLAARGSPAGLGFVIVDVEGLKRVNEESGFLAGDDMLRAAAERLRAAATRAALVARLGGDELVAVFEDPAAAEEGARTLSTPGPAPRLRVGFAVGAADDTRETLINRLYATARAS